MMFAGIPKTLASGVLENNTQASAIKQAEDLIMSNRASEAIRSLKQVESELNNSSRYHLLLGRAYQETKANTDALASYSVAIYLEPTNWKALVNRALVKGALRDLEGAIRDLDKALLINPKNPVILMNRGVTRAALNQPDLALKDFSLAIRLDSKYADAYRNRGITYNYVGKKAMACQDWDSASKLGQIEPRLWSEQLCKKTRKGP